MGRVAGKQGRVYVAMAPGAEASNLPFQAKWNIDFSMDQLEVTSLDDDNKVYTADLPDASGGFSGFYDDATSQTYTAATDGTARKFYLYPDRSTTSKYFFGTILPDFRVSGGVGESTAVECSWKAASPIRRVP